MLHGRTTRIGLFVYGLIFLAFSYIPIIATILASFAESAYLSFPLRGYSVELYDKAIHTDALVRIFLTSLKIAVVVAIASMIIGFLGGLAFGRYRWRFRKAFQKLVLLPIFFPQQVLGLALLIWFNELGLSPNWITAVIAHLVWIGPIATLIVAIQAYSLNPELEEAARDMNASNWQVLSRITLPLLWPATLAAGIFGFLLSWGNFALSLYTTGIDRTLPVWAFSRMVNAYTPMVSVMGAISVIVSVFSVVLCLVFVFCIRKFSAARLTRAKREIS